MSESMWDAFGVNANDVDENPFKIPANTYDVVISGAGVATHKDIPYFEVEISIVGGAEAGKSAKIMHRTIPWTSQERDDWQAMNMRLLANYKKDLLAFGIPAGALQEFKPAIHGPKLMGIKGKAWMGPQKNNPDFNTVRNFTRNDNGAGAQSSAPSQVAANPAPVENAAIDMDALAGWANN
ncbi:hypothetical protein NELLIE_38 [Arthrobacter phage Nellie]|uniref:Uncharacterized protein n=3 Tax=Jasminevirus adat TaxID=2560299 RepID=A0A249XN81_9CAUD|nr:hypothetical protein GURGLEFERB_38 [Arthrobacter phage GurgleFerb]ASZ73756.1 hypothetical protein NELLIE_38 [Arthrobacter phage Nellie]AXH43726.1 hypothetical protein SEA_BRAD_38 [Arthrobacter phage Brad]